MLGVIVSIRIVLSFALEVEIDGGLAWNEGRRQLAGRATRTSPAGDDSAARDAPSVER